MDCLFKPFSHSEAKMPHELLSTYSSSSSSSGHETPRSSVSALRAGQAQKDTSSTCHQDGSETSRYAESETNCSISEKLQTAVVQEKVYDIHTDEKHITRTLHKLWVEEKLCDVILSVDNTQFKVHRVVLVAYSGYFYDHFITSEASSAVSELPLSKIPLAKTRSEVMRKMLQGIYSTKIRLDSLCVEDMLATASFLRIPAVIGVCQSFLCDTLSLDNGINYLRIANHYKLEDLLEHAYELICANFTVVSKQHQFNALDFREILSIVQRQDVIVKSEIEIFRAVVSWLEHEKPKRAKHTGSLMKYVRFPMMTKDELVDRVECCDLVSESSELNDYVREAIRFHLLPFRRSILQTARTVPRSQAMTEVIVTCGGGSTEENGRSASSIYYHDINGERWKPIAGMPEPRHYHAATTLGNYIYVAGGATGMSGRNTSRKAWRYDPYGEIWLRIANLLEPRQTFQIEPLDDRLYAVGGRNDENSALHSVERYNPSTNAWSWMASTSTPRSHVALAAFGGILYAAGGLENDGISCRVERFNPVTSEWEIRCPLPQPRFAGTLCSACDYLWLIGGYKIDNNGRARSFAPLASIEVYSPESDQWTNVDVPDHLIKSVEILVEKGSEIRDSKKKSDHQAANNHSTKSTCCVIRDRLFLMGGLDSETEFGVHCVILSGIIPNFAESYVHRGILGVNTATKLDLDQCPLHFDGAACTVARLYKEPRFRFQ